jgi:hypothetical protein
MLSVIEVMQNCGSMEHYNSSFACEMLFCSGLKLDSVGPVHIKSYRRSRVSFQSFLIWTERDKWLETCPGHLIHREENRNK